MDKIIIDFNLLQPSNDRDEISFNWDGNSIISNLLQFENDDSLIVVRFDCSWNDTFSKLNNNKMFSFQLFE